MIESDLFAPMDEERKKWIQFNESFQLASRSTSHQPLQSIIKNRMALIALGIVLSLILMAVIGPLLTPHLPDEIHLSSKNLPPGSRFWFGTDELGRDLFARCCWGARISLFVGVAAALIDGIIGVLYGSIAGFLGGRWEEVMMRIADILYTIPYLLLVILLMVLLGQGMTSILIGLTFTGWITMARIVRNHIVQLKNQDFALAAKGLGASRKRILFVHLLPNTISSIIVTGAFTIPSAIFTEAFLSFLGLGVQAPTASWGTLAYDGLAALRFYPWRLFIPAFFISAAILSFNVMGDALRDAFDYRAQR